METHEETVIIPVEADISEFSKALSDMEKNSKKFGSTFASTISSAIRSGRTFEETLKSLALNLSGVALNAGLKPAEGLVSDFFSNSISGLTSSIGSSFGESANTIPFLSNGTSSKGAALLGGASNIGLTKRTGMDAGLPSSRSPRGQLEGTSYGGSHPVQITFNVTSPDVGGFKKSENQIAQMLAKTVGRSRRGG